MLLALFIVLAGVPVSGRVVDAESGNPIAGAHVELIPERNMTVTSPRSLDAITDQNGRFVLEGVEPGHYLANARKAGFAPIIDPAEMPAVDVIEGRAFTGVEISLTKGGAMTGRIVDARGEPVAGIIVTALLQSVDQSADGIRAFTTQMTQSNDLGEFRLAGLHAGRYTVVAAPGPPTAFGQPAAATIGEVLAPTFYPGTTDKDAAEILTVAAAQTVTGLQFSIVAIPAYQVSGVVVDDAGAPLSGATLMLLPESHDGGGIMPLFGRSDEAGTFRIGGVVPGTHRIVASMPTIWTAPDGSGVIGASGGGAGGAGGVVATGGVFIGGSGRGGPGVPPPWPTTMPPPAMATTMPPIEVTVGNADLTGLKIVVTRR